MQATVASLAIEIGAAVPAQAVDPAVVFDAPRPVRAVATFGLVLLGGGLLLHRRKPLLDHSRDATLSHPLRAVLYGVATHAVIAFAAVYLASQFALVEVGGVNFGPGGLLLGGGLVVASGSVGFAVVGVSVVDVWGTATDWPGVALGALLAGSIASLGPLLAGVAWVALVSFGIGGAIRDWLQTSAAPDI